MAKKKTIFVFTGGGLSPSLNPTLASIIESAQKRGWRIFGGVRGWASLLPGGQYKNITHFSVKDFKKSGGTFLKSSRTNPSKYPGGYSHVIGKIKKLRLDALVAIGGDDTLSAAQGLYLEREAMVYGIPKTIDNDIPGTYVTPGFSTAAERFGQMVHELHTRAAYAFSRIYVIEAMGLHAGWLTAAGYLGGADLIVPPERPVSLKHFLKTLRQRYKANGGYATVALSQEANFTGGVMGLADDQVDDYSISRHQFICLALKKIIKDKLGIDTKAILPGNFLESGDPNRTDQTICSALGRATVERIAHEDTPAMAVIEYKAGRLAVRYREWQGVDLDPTPCLTDDLFDFKNFCIKPKLKNYFKSLGLQKISVNKKPATS